MKSSLISMISLWILLALSDLPAALATATEFTRSFELSTAAEVVARVTARCDACAWDAAGREAVTLSVSVDGRYAAHLPLVRQGRADYRLMLGPAAAGRHTIRVDVDRDLTAADLRKPGAAIVESVEVAAVDEKNAEHTALSFAPFLYARPNTIGRFTDAPVFMWYEQEPTNRGTRYRYSVVFTNEDGGTPTDRLMATWGRTTDIEYVYSVEVDPGGAVLSDDLQGPNHEILAFGGKREGRHALLWVATDNNMVRDAGETRVRYAPAPVAFSLNGVSREAVMDANPWLYALAAQELVREGKIVEGAPPGQGAIPDPRRFVYVEGCGVVGDAALAIDVRAGDRWFPSDRGVIAYRIVRDGCFRAAIPLPLPLGADNIQALRVNAYAGADGRAADAVRLDRINTVFMLDNHHQPGPSILRWSGPASIGVGSSLEIPRSVADRPVDEHLK